MQLSDFNFPFDPSLIAKHPIRPRDHARLLVVPRGQGTSMDRQVNDLPHLLRPNDLVVINDTKVLPVRVVGRKVPSGGKIEVLFVRKCEEEAWEVFLKGRVRVGQSIAFGSDCQATVIERGPDRTVIRLNSPVSLPILLEQFGTMPLPPYIKRQPTNTDRDDYQTMFAKVEGAIAAPTAGLHFTPELIARLESQGVQWASVTLHVGPGTFRPVTTQKIEQHQMDHEWFEVPDVTATAIRNVRERGGRVVAVGTTVARSLEAAVKESGEIYPQRGQTNLFITPGFQFRVVDVLMTNFHLPGTTLLMLIAAFAGLDQARAAYEHAVQSRYRFYSYGDGMLIQ